MARATKAGQIIGSRQQRRQIESGDPWQGQDQQLGEQEALPLEIRGINPPIRHGTPPTDVDLVGNLLTGTEHPVADQSTPLLTADQQLQQALLGHQALQRP